MEEAGLEPDGLSELDMDEDTSIVVTVELAVDTVTEAVLEVVSDCKLENVSVVSLELGIVDEDSVEPVLALLELVVLQEVSDDEDEVAGTVSEVLTEVLTEVSVGSAVLLVEEGCVSSEEVLAQVEVTVEISVTVVVPVVVLPWKALIPKLDVENMNDRDLRAQGIAN